MHHHLGVGFSLEAAAFGAQFAAQRMEVLDDAVVHQNDTIVAVRMGVDRGRSAVGGPSGVADADQPVHWIVL